jgi:hypothetical protein
MPPRVDASTRLVHTNNLLIGLNNHVNNTNNAISQTNHELTQTNRQLTKINDTINFTSEPNFFNAFASSISLLFQGFHAVKGQKIHKNTEVISSTLLTNASLIF